MARPGSLRPLRRPPSERLAAWLATGPVGHLYGTIADVGAAWTRYAAGRLRARRRT